MPNSAVISAAVEGFVDEAVLHRLLLHVGAMPGPVHGKNGKPHLRQQMNAYNQAAYFSTWVVLVDLDQDAHCAPPLCGSWLPDPAPYMCFRVAVREVETWILADRERLAHFLSVSPSRIPHDPERVNDPKQIMVNLARYSRRREVREDMVPRPESGRRVGPAYVSRLIEFVEDIQIGWQPDIAAQSSNSLERCLRRLRQLMERIRHSTLN